MSHLARCLLMFCAAAIAALPALAAVAGQPSVERVRAHQVRAQPPLLGVNMHPLQSNYSTYDARRTLRLAAGLGVSVVRIDIQWGWMEYEQPGAATWDAWEVGWLDPFLAEAARLHIKVLATVVNSPCWASSEPGKQCPPGPAHYRFNYPPREPSLYAAFLRRFIAHVGTKIQYYEIWNEPNLSATWLDPNPTTYTRLLKAAYRAIKASDPHAQVLAGATSGADARFIEGMYHAGAKGYFDAISIHPYTGPRSPNDCSIVKRSLKCGVEAVRAVMLRNGDTSPIWLTEFGQSISEVTPAAQARYVTQSLSMIRRWSYVRGAIWYELFDDPTGHDGEHFGLFAGDLTPRPAAYAFSAGLLGRR